MVIARESLRKTLGQFLMKMVTWQIEREKKQGHSMVFMPQVFNMNNRPRVAQFLNLEDNNCENSDLPFVKPQTGRSQL